MYFRIGEIDSTIISKGGSPNEGGET